MFVDVGVQTKLTGEELDKTIQDLRREKKILQQKLIRRNNRVSNMGEMIHLLRKNNLIEDFVEDIFKNQFNSSLPINKKKIVILFQSNLNCLLYYRKNVRMKIQILRGSAKPRNQERRGRSNVLFCFNQI